MMPSLGAMLRFIMRPPPLQVASDCAKKAEAVQQRSLQLDRAHQVMQLDAMRSHDVLGNLLRQMRGAPP